MKGAFVAKSATNPAFIADVVHRQGVVGRRVGGGAVRCGPGAGAGKTCDCSVGHVHHELDAVVGEDEVHLGALVVLGSDRHRRLEHPGHDAKRLFDLMGRGDVAGVLVHALHGRERAASLRGDTARLSEI